MQDCLGWGHEIDSCVQTLRDLSFLPTVQQASLREVMAFIERKTLYGHGCGLIDLILLASTLMTPGTQLWTLDKRLNVNIAHPAPLH